MPNHSNVYTSSHRHHHHHHYHQHHRNGANFPFHPLSFFIYSLLFLLLPFPPSAEAETKSSASSSSTSYYNSNSLDLDFLCKSFPTIQTSAKSASVTTAAKLPVAFVRDVPWDCSAYVVCLRGRAFHGQCTHDRIYSGSGRGRKCLAENQLGDQYDRAMRRCRGTLFDYIEVLCQTNPRARIPSPDSCAHYVDCGARTTTAPTATSATGPSDTAPAVFLDGLLECSYPSLFSPATGRCEDYRYVRCRNKFEPKAPCDYLQYLQLYDCRKPDCPECLRHHPSCVSLRDGLHPVAGRSDVMMKCLSMRTVDFVTCPSGFQLPRSSLVGGVSNRHQQQQKREQRLPVRCVPSI